MRLISLVLFLFGFWLLLSGHYTAFLIAVGFLTSVGIVALAHRMGIVDREGHPVELIPASLVYWPWLAKEIFISALDVSKIILTPSLPISPTMLRVDADQASDLGVNIFANSITLTPGTISVGVTKEDITVHALTRNGADAMEQGAMNRRVAKLEER